MIYFARRPDGCVKIGTSGKPRNRLYALRREHGDVAILATMAGSYGLEGRLQSYFFHLRVEGEWYRPDGELSDLIERAKRGESWVPNTSSTEAILTRNLRVRGITTVGHAKAVMEVHGPQWCFLFEPMKSLDELADDAPLNRLALEVLSKALGVRGLALLRLPRPRPHGRKLKAELEPNGDT